ncbi:MAG: hypothetical protein FWC47_06955 [Oscillospiraceae bacterium]|nr:hypothetical protein [Oscillospiraceae bacterium]
MIKKTIKKPPKFVQTYIEQAVIHNRKAQRYKEKLKGWLKVNEINVDISELESALTYEMVITILNKIRQSIQ